MHNAEDDAPETHNANGWQMRDCVFISNGSAVNAFGSVAGVTVTFTVLNTERVQERLIEAEGE